MLSRFIKNRRILTWAVWVPVLIHHNSNIECIFKLSTHLTLRNEQLHSICNLWEFNIYTVVAKIKESATVFSQKVSLTSP